jgi:hypothetical protein
MSDRDLPWSKFYWSDYESDNALRQCSLAAQGLWMRMLCICAKSEPRGYLTVAGVPLDVEALALAISRPAKEVKTLLEELEKWAVFSRDRRGKIYNRRMIADGKRAKKCKTNGAKGGNPRLCEGGTSPGKTTENSAWDNPQKPEARSQKPEARSQKPESTTEDDADFAARATDDGPSRGDPADHGDGAEPATGVIRAFDDALAEAFGEAARRPWPVATDLAEARRWLAAGADLPLCRAVFRAVLQRRSAVKGSPPNGLRYFDRAIADAMATANAAMPQGVADGGQARQGVTGGGGSAKPWEAWGLTEADWRASDEGRAVN